MTGHHADEPSADEVERGRAALRELGVEPLPGDVLARLEGRLEGELGRPAPARRRRRRFPRLAFAIPGAGVALAAVVVVAVLATDNGGGGTPQLESASSIRAKSAAPVLPKAAAGGAAADSSAAPSTFAARVQVPELVGHGLGYVKRATRAKGLKWAYAAGTTCPPVAGVKVERQSPAAGKTVAAGTTIRISIGRCGRYSGGS